MKKIICIVIILLLLAGATTIDSQSPDNAFEENLPVCGTPQFEVQEIPMTIKSMTKTHTVDEKKHSVIMILHSDTYGDFNYNRSGYLPWEYQDLEQGDCVWVRLSTWRDSLTHKILSQEVDEIIQRYK